MNYIAEIRAFYDWVECNTSVSASSISLWHGLMYQANKTGWKSEFTVAISTLELRTGLKRGAIYKARNVLKQCGAISFKERTGNQSAVYTIHSLCSFNEHNSDTTVNTTATQNDVCPFNEHNSDTSVNTIATQTDTQQRHNREPLLNETKLNETKHNSRVGVNACAHEMPEAKIRCAEFVSMTNGEYSSLVAEYGERLTKQFVETLDNYKGAKGVHYESDYRAILSWVIKRHKEQADKRSKSEPQYGSKQTNGGKRDTSDPFLDYAREAYDDANNDE